MRTVTTEEKEKIRNEVMSETQRELSKAGFGLPKLVKKLGRLLDAKNDHTKIKALDMAFELGNYYPPKNQKVEFPDANGKPQSIGGLFTDMERATRLVYLLDQAAKRKKNAERSGKD